MDHTKRADRKAKKVYDSMVRKQQEEKERERDEMVKHKKAHAVALDRGQVRQAALAFLQSLCSPPPILISSSLHFQRICS